MHPYVKKLKSLFEQNANPSQAPAMKKYMRDQYEFLGIKTPQRKVLQKAFYAKHGLPDIADLDTVLHDLWKLPEREYQHVGLGMLSKFEERLPEKFLPTLEFLIVTKSWWDTVDALASHPVGAMFKRYTTAKSKYLKKWRSSNNIWLRRTTLLFQLSYKSETDFDLLCDLIRENLDTEEFFINKAIGWSLRQYARTNPKAVKKFVKDTQELSLLSRSEAMKHLE